MVKVLSDHHIAVVDCRRANEHVELLYQLAVAAQVSLRCGVCGQGVVDGKKLENILYVLSVMLVARVLGVGIAVEQFGNGELADIAVAATYAAYVVSYSELVLQQEDADIRVK